MAAAVELLKVRALVQETDIQAGIRQIQQHNLLRDAAYKDLQADLLRWQAAERQAAHLWLTAYEPPANAENIETVRGYLEAFDHFCAVEDWEEAGKIAKNQNVRDRLIFGGYYRDAIAFFQRLLGRVESALEVICARCCGNAYYYLSNYSQAIQFWSQSLEITRSIHDKKGEGMVLGNMGNAYYCLGDYQQAIDFHQQSLTIAQEIGDKLGKGIALGNLGNAYYCLGDYERAIDFHQQDLAIAREIGDKQGESNALCNLGNAYEKRGDYEQAIDLYQQSLTIAQEIGDKLGEATVLCNLGTANEERGDYQQAIDFHQQSLTNLREIGNKKGEATVLGNLGITYEKLGDYDQSVDYARQHLTIAREIGDRQGEGEGLREMGVALMRQNSTTNEALENLQTALSIFQEVKSRSDEADALKNLAELHQALGKVRVAQQYCQQALALATELGIPLKAECETLLKELTDGERS